MQPALPPASQGKSGLPDLRTRTNGQTQGARSGTAQEKFLFRTPPAPFAHRLGDLESVHAPSQTGSLRNAGRNAGRFSRHDARTGRFRTSVLERRDSIRTFCVGRSVGRGIFGARNTETSSRHAGRDQRQIPNRTSAQNTEIQGRSADCGTLGLDRILT